MNRQSTTHDLPFTWDDYRSWEDGQRWELIDGEAYAMSPAPRTRHQSIVVELAFQAVTRLRGKRCKPFVSPIDIRLSDVDVVQPDLVVVHVLDGATYRLIHSLSKDDTLRSPTLPDLTVDLAPVFDFPLEPGEEPPVAREPPPRRYGGG